MLKQKYLVLLAILKKFFAEYILNLNYLETKVLDYVAICFVGCYRTIRIQNDLLVYAVQCDGITEFLGLVNIIDFRKYQSRLRTFLNRASSDGDQLYATSLAQRGFIYIEHAGENLILCPFCFNFFYYNQVNDENECTHAERCPFAARNLDQHGHNLGVMNLAVDVEDREIFRNVNNLYNFPFIESEYYGERTREDNVDASVLSISIRNLNEFQNIHVGENQIASQLSVVQNVNSSNIVQQETDTDLAASFLVIGQAPSLMPLSNNVITHSSYRGCMVRDASSGITISNTVSKAPDLSSVVSSVTSEIAFTKTSSSNSDEAPSFLSCATQSTVVPFNRLSFDSAKSTSITAQTRSTVSTNCASDRHLISSSTAVKQTSSEAITQTSTTAVLQTSSTAVTQRVLKTSPNFIRGNEGGRTYSELGIVTERPMRSEYTVLRERMWTFSSWPRDHHLNPKELAEAGFYYAGFGDFVQCFYCGGSLRNWKDEDDVWVEHARWFPKCAYIRQQMGQVFVDTVQKLNKTHENFSLKTVKEKIGDASSAFQLEMFNQTLKEKKRLLCSKCILASVTVYLS